MVWKPGKDR
jgi:hypothetical protein